MPNKQIIRERVIRLIDERAPIARYTLEKMFATSTRPLAKQIISELIGENYIAITGRARRGSPAMIVRSAGWPEHTCPLCGQERVPKGS